MSRIAKKSDLIKSDLKDFSIGLTEAKNLKITKADLRGIKEIVPNKKYKIRSTIGDRKSETFSGSLLEAIKRKEQLNNQSEPLKKEKNNSDKSNMMFMDGVRLYIDNLFQREQRGDIDINTIYDHIRKIDGDISDFFCKYKINEIDSDLVEEYIDHMRKRPSKQNSEKNISEQSIANNLRTLNAIFNFFVIKKIIFVNPYNETTNKPKAKKGKKELNYFKSEEAKYAIYCLNKFADIRLKTFMNIIFSLGCRREEACGIRWCDIDFETKEVNFKYAMTSTVPKKFLNKIKEKDLNINDNTKYERIREKNLKTDNSYRTNYLSDIATDYLKKYYKFKIACGIDVKLEDFVFTNYREARYVDKIHLEEEDYFSDNKPADPNKLTHQWKEFKKLYKIKDVDLHRIRHTVANILEKKGVPKKDIAKMLGNTERVLEEFYTHVDPEELKKLRNTIDVELFNDIEYIDLNIELVVKIVNEYPLETLTDEELKKVDLILYTSINSDNYIDSIKRAKDIILTTDGSINYFIDDDNESLKIKIESYNRFSKNNIIKIPKEKDISIRRDILSF